MKRELQYSCNLNLKELSLAKMCLFFKKDPIKSKFYPKQAEKYRNVEKFFYRYSIPFHTDFIHENHMFDYSFMYKGKVYLLDIYFTPNEEINFGSKLNWSISHDIPYYIVYSGNAMEILERTVIFSS